MSNAHANAGWIWWSYLGRTYPDCRKSGFLWAPGESGHLIRQLHPGDLVVHEYRREIVSVSRITAEPWLAAAPGSIKLGSSRQSVWLATAKYQDLAAPVPFDELRDTLRQAEPSGGPMHAADGSGVPGGLYPFNEAALEIILDETGSILDLP